MQEEFFVGISGDKYEIFPWAKSERPCESAMGHASIAGPFFSEAAAAIWVDRQTGIFGSEPAPARVDRPRGF